MDRDKIKIVEFGMDDESRPKSRLAESETMKVVEFGDEWEDGRQRPVTGNDVGHIKIVESRGGPPAESHGVPPKAQPKKTGKMKAMAGQMKIVEFDQESEETGSLGRNSKIKIIEFD